MDTDRPTAPGVARRPAPMAHGWRSIIVAGIGIAAVVGLTLAGHAEAPALWAVVGLVALAVLGKDITPAIEAVTALAGVWRGGRGP